jgi:hypothetical protein
LNREKPLQKLRLGWPYNEFRVNPVARYQYPLRMPQSLQGGSIGPSRRRCRSSRSDWRSGGKEVNDALPLMAVLNLRDGMNLSAIQRDNGQTDPSLNGIYTIRSSDGGSRKRFVFERIDENGDPVGLFVVKTDGSHPRLIHAQREAYVNGRQNGKRLASVRGSHERYRGSLRRSTTPSFRSTAAFRRIRANPRERPGGFASRRSPVRSRYAPLRFA